MPPLSFYYFVLKSNILCDEMIENLIFNQG